MDGGHSDGIDRPLQRAAAFCLTGLSMASLAVAALVVSGLLWLAIWAVL